MALKLTYILCRRILDSTKVTGIFKPQAVGTWPIAGVAGAFDLEIIQISSRNTGWDGD